jgi:transcriptional regulator with XRE-family HTH domain
VNTPEGAKKSFESREAAGRVLSARKAAGLSVSAVAALTGISVGRVSELERGLTPFHSEQEAEAILFVINQGRSPFVPSYDELRREHEGAGGSGNEQQR